MEPNTGANARADLILFGHTRVQVRHCSIPALVGAVGLAKHTREDPEGAGGVVGGKLVGLEIHFPPEVSLQPKVECE